MQTRKKVMPRWPTRVFGFEVVQKLMAACDTERAHFDLALAKELQVLYNFVNYIFIYFIDV